MEITFKTSKLLSEKDLLISEVDYYYNKKGEKVINSILDKFINGGKYPAPKQSVLQKVLRKNYKLHVQPYIADSGFYYVDVVKENGIEENKIIFQGVDFKTYEDALEKGLEQALNFLD